MTLELALYLTAVEILSLLSTFKPKKTFNKPLKNSVFYLGSKSDSIGSGVLYPQNRSDLREREAFLELEGEVGIGVESIEGSKGDLTQSKSIWVYCRWKAKGITWLEKK